LLAGAYRDTEASTGLLSLAGSAQQLMLAGLAPDDVAAMIEDIAGSETAAQVSSQLWQRSGGNPFFVRELTRLLLAQGPWREHTHIPASVAETLRRRLARLCTPCVRLLDWAAVAGRDIDTALLVRCGAATDEAEALGLLDEARRAGVIVGDRDDPCFAHDLYRETILDGLSPSMTADINLSVGQALREMHGTVAQVASHFLAAGPRARRSAIDFSILAARESTVRLGHEDACAHYLRALRLIDSAGDRNTDDRAEILLELAAAYERAGSTDLARHRYSAAADAGKHAADAVILARAALGLQSLGERSGAQNTTTIELLGEAARRLELSDGPLALRSRVLAALARAVRHGSSRVRYEPAGPPDSDVVRTARQAVDLATTAGDAHALAVAGLALHDSLWLPGTAAQRLPVITEMLDAAKACGDNDLVAEAHLLQAAALLELGDPAGRDELLTYITLAGELGHARGRWGALTRQATFAQLAGRAEESARFGDQALELGLAIGEPDAMGCFCTSRWSLVALGVRAPDLSMDAGDPLWPMFPLLRAWPLAVGGQLDAAVAALGDFSVLDVADSTSLEGLAAAAVVFAAVGSAAQRSWAYERLHPYAGTHVVVGGCAAYHAAVDHHLGALAASLGDIASAETHFRAALAMHERLGAAGWARLSRQALADLAATPARMNEFRRINGIWQLSFQGTTVQLPDSKGLRDLAVLIGAKGADVHVYTLVGHDFARTGADPVLDDTAKARFKARLAALAQEIQDAEEFGDPRRVEKLDSERDALIHGLTVAAGLGGRSRRLGDDTERARKTVSARVRDALSKIDPVHPDLADHLRRALQMGTVCSYAPSQPTTWTVS